MNTVTIPAPAGELQEGHPHRQGTAALALAALDRKSVV